MFAASGSFHSLFLSCFAFVFPFLHMFFLLHIHIHIFIFSSSSLYLELNIVLCTLFSPLICHNSNHEVLIYTPFTHVHYILQVLT